MNELSPDDVILGISPEGKISWSSIAVTGKKEGHTIRITTDTNELFLAPNCEIFTLEGIKKASVVSLGLLIETTNIPSEVVERLDRAPFQSIKFDGLETSIDEKLGYVIGAQIRSKRYPHKVVFDKIDTEKAPLLAHLCNEVRKTLDAKAKIFYVEGGKKIRIDSWIFAKLCETIWKPDNIPLAIRVSPPRVMRAFTAGMLDMTLQKNEAQNPPTFFSTYAYESELRRFTLNVLRLCGITPARMNWSSRQDGSILLKYSINTSDLKKLGMRFIRAVKMPKIIREVKAISYSVVRNVSYFRDTVFCLVTPEPHWSPIVDLTPLHRHVLQS